MLSIKENISDGVAGKITGALLVQVNDKINLETMIENRRIFTWANWGRTMLIDMKYYIKEVI